MKIRAGWLYRTAVNLVWMPARDSRRSRREERAQRERRGARVRESLYELPPRSSANGPQCDFSLKPIQDKCFLMGSSGFTCKEIAVVLGVKPDSLYVLISRAKAQFEKEYVSLYGRAE